MDHQLGEQTPSDLDRAAHLRGQLLCAPIWHAGEPGAYRRHPVSRLARRQTSRSTSVASCSSRRRQSSRALAANAATLATVPAASSAAPGVWLAMKAALTGCSGSRPPPVVSTRRPSRRALMIAWRVTPARAANCRCDSMATDPKQSGTNSPTPFVPAMARAPGGNQIPASVTSDLMCLFPPHLVHPAKKSFFVAGAVGAAYAQMHAVHLDYAQR
jgi:hypothetical protein